MASIRIERVNSELKRAAADIVRNKVSDPKVTEMVSVVDAEVSPDLKNAKIFVSVYGTDEDKREQTFAALKRAEGFVRHSLAGVMRELRTIPAISFVWDKTGDYSAHIYGLLDKIKDEGKE